MNVPSHLVVNSLHPIEGSVLGRIVNESEHRSCLEILRAIEIARLLAETQAQLAALRNQQEHAESLTPYERRKIYANWCPVCKEYVADSHDGPKGMACEKYVQRRAQREAAHLAKMREQTRLVFSRNPNNAWKKGQIHQNYVEDRMIARVDQLRRNDIESRQNARWDQVSSITLADDEVVEDIKAAPTTRVQHKPKRHYVRHTATRQTVGFVRQQDLNLANDNLRS